MHPYQYLAAHTDRVVGVVPNYYYYSASQRHGVFRLFVCRPYLTRRLEADSRAIKQHQEQIKKSQKETNDMLKQIEQLQTAPKIFSNRKCTASGLDLELPSVHFMNGNSYVQRGRCSCYVRLSMCALLWLLTSPVVAALSSCSE